MTFTSQDIPLLLSLMGCAIALWSARMASRQAGSARKQADISESTAMLQEIQTLYASRYQALEGRCATIESDARLFRVHAERCETELKKLQEQLIGRKHEA